MKDQTAIVGVGSTGYWPIGESQPRTELELLCKAMLAAADDAGISIDAIDGVTSYAHRMDLGVVAETLGLRDLRFGASVTGGGNGAPGSVGLAAVAVASGQADMMISAVALQQTMGRMTAAFAPSHADDAQPTGRMSASYVPSYAQDDFFGVYGLCAPGHLAALVARRQMHRFGITREHFAEVAISQRNNAIRRPSALQREPLSLEQYFQAPILAEPLCIHDYPLESDGAIAIITTSAERARDLRHPPVYISAAAMGGDGRWGSGISWMGMPDDIFPMGPAASTAQSLYARAEVRPADIDVALLFDAFTPYVLAQLEVYGFCAEGESGSFVADGNIRWPSGSLPVNTHGGNLAEAYVLGMTHVKEAVEQFRGTAVNQVENAEVALVGGATTRLPVSSLIMRR